MFKLTAQPYVLAEVLRVAVATPAVNLDTLLVVVPHLALLHQCAAVDGVDLEATEVALLAIPIAQPPATNVVDRIIMLGIVRLRP
jgi:hypothetical protein